MTPMRAHFRPFGMLAIAAKAWGEEFEIKLALGEVPNPEPFTRVGPLAVVDIKGPLVHHAHWCWDSYDAIQARTAAAFCAADVEAVILRINSPGGDVDGCFDAAQGLRAMRTKHGKPLIAFADGTVASAAYALACAADQIALTSTSQVGSIGIIEAMRDQAAHDEEIGLRYVFVTSGARKADGNPHVPISEAAVSNLQGQVDQMAELFFELIEELRGVPRATARGLEARTLIGARAVDAGLGDLVTTWPILTQTSEAAAARSGTPSGAPSMQASYLRRMLRSIAESKDPDDSETDREHAKKCIQMLEGASEEGAPPEKKKDEADGKKAEGEAEGKKAEAEGDDDGDEKEAEGKKGKKAESKKAEARPEGEAEGKRAQASVQTSEVLELAARLHKLEAERADEREAAERATMFAKRPDFSPEIKATLQKASLEQLREAVEKWPRIPGRTHSPAAASQTAGTRGAGHKGEPGDASEAPEHEQNFIARKMGAVSQNRGIVREGRSLELGVMTPEQADAWLKKQDTQKEAV